MTDPIPFTLPSLQKRLDDLEPDEMLVVSKADFDRLFGVDDAAVGRLKNFADGHNCMATWSRSDLRFRKAPNIPATSDHPKAAASNPE
jgi:hypothetical protein